MRELTMGELDAVSGASEWGDNVLKYGGTFGAIGAFGGLKGAAAGIIIGAVVGTVVTIIE
jgi:hypothetical protein